MVGKCANPACSAAFLYLHAGKLFRFETAAPARAESDDMRKPPRGVEFFWLCAGCAAEFTLVPDTPTGARLVPLAGRAFGAAR